jgi:low temperature requirement protein LtrA
VSQQLAKNERPVAPLELFLDLVFVFGFTQVTTLLSEDPTWTGLGHALLILAVLWWAWASYAWLTNNVDADEGTNLAVILAATAAMFVAALAVPEAFGDHGVLFGTAFLVVSVMQGALYSLAARDDRDFLAAIQRVVPWALGGATLILVAGFFDGTLRVVLWVAALALGLVAPGFAGLQGWRVQPAHFVERHGLIVIIAIGESLVAIGIGARGTHLGAGVVVAAVLGLVVAMAFWLAYFDFFAIRGRQLLDDRRGEERIALARDVYTYLHLPMIVGIVLFAFAMKSTIAHIGDELGTIEALALGGGPALYLLTFAALRFRVARKVGRGRLVAAIACASLIPVARVVPALVALALVTAVWLALHAYELIWWREARAETRALRPGASAAPQTPAAD